VRIAEQQRGTLTVEVQHGERMVFAFEIVATANGSASG